LQQIIPSKTHPPGTTSKVPIQHFTIPTFDPKQHLNPNTMLLAIQTKPLL